MYINNSSVEDIEPFELSAEHGPAFEAEPPIQHGGIDPAEVGMEFQAAVIQIGETGARAYEAAFELAPSQEHRGSGAVPGATPAILLEGPAKLREGHQQNPLQQFVPL